jgi:hypothetical protein
MPAAQQIHQAKSSIFSNYPLTFPLDYSWYSAQPLSEQVDWFDQLEWNNIAQLSQERNIRRFLEDVYENDASSYTRLKAIEWYSELALGRVIPTHAAMTFLLDATEQETYIQIAKLKYLFIIFGDEPEVYRELDRALDSTDAEIASEAYYRKGLVHLLYRANQVDEGTLFEQLNQAEYLFNQAANMLENRVDASFFNLVTQCLRELLAEQLEAYDATFQQMEAILWQRTLWSRKKVSDLFEWNVYHSLINIRSLATHTAREKYWVDYKREFAILAKHFNDAVVVDSLSSKFQKTYKQFTSGVATLIINQYYTHNLSACQTKINAVAAETISSDPALSSFLLELTERIHNQQQKKNTKPDLGFAAKLNSIFPELTFKQIDYELEQRTAQGESIEIAAANLAIDYAAKANGNRTLFKTGYPTGDEVLDRLASDLKWRLQGYPKKQWEIFLTALADIVNYAYRAETLPKRFFSHLYDPTITAEAAFQDPLFTALTSGQRAAYYRYEPADRIGGGRIDIVYQEQEVIVPIEVKKDSQIVTWESVQTNYLAQAQTYTLPYSQLGILVIFDISPKQGNAPKNDFRERFAILQLKPLARLSGNFPDFIVAAIIHGNNVSPSTYSNYSK